MENVENCFGVNKSQFSFKGKQNIDHVTFVHHMTVIIALNHEFFKYTVS